VKSLRYWQTCYRLITLPSMLNWYDRCDDAGEGGADRYAVTGDRSPSVIGYVFQNPD
jgi:hypothetical protein